MGFFSNRINRVSSTYKSYKCHYGCVRVSFFHVSIFRHGSTVLFSPIIPVEPFLLNSSCLLRIDKCSLQGTFITPALLLLRKIVA